MLKKITLLAVCASLFFAGCAKKDYSSSEYAGQSALRIKKLKADEKKFIENKNICIVLGYGYESEEARERITAKLEQNFGIEGEDKKALISLLFYPDDFKKYGPVRISQLAENVEDKNLAGIIIYGAPEGMNLPLAKLQDLREENEISYPVYNFFPQDDILGSESTSDFVVDYAVSTAETEMSAETMSEEANDDIPDYDPDALLVNAVNTIISTKGVVPAPSELKNFVSTVIGQGKEIKHFHDAETGLKSINHFIFE